MDELLNAEGITLKGPEAVDAVAMHHGGFVLYPLGDENGEDVPEGICTAAAFSPSDLEEELD